MPLVKQIDYLSWLTNRKTHLEYYVFISHLGDYMYMRKKKNIILSKRIWFEVSKDSNLFLSHLHHCLCYFSLLSLSHVVLDLFISLLSLSHFLYISKCLYNPKQFLTIFSCLLFSFALLFLLSHLFNKIYNLWNKHKPSIIYIASLTFFF